MNDINWPVYIKLGAMFFLEFAVWGVWMPVLAARLLGPLKMSGKQTGLIYATLPLASLVAFPLAGQLADKYWDAGTIMVVCHAIGAVLLFVIARIEKFGPLFVGMLLYSLFFGATLPLANVLIFRHAGEANVAPPYLFIWAPIAWALVGYLLTGLRQASLTKADGADALKLAALFSVAMVLVCLVLPETAPKAEGTPILKAISLLKEPNFLAFTLVSLVVAGMMQFYFQGSAQFMQDVGISGKNVSAAMAVAQAVQAIATVALLGWLYKTAGPRWTLAIGAGCWALFYLVYIASQNRALIVLSQGLHGLAYVFFINAGWMFVDEVATKDIQSSAQSLIYLATNGIGLFLGTQVAGVVMDKFKEGGKFQWKKIFVVPLLVALGGVVVLALAVKDPVKAAAPETPAAQAAESAK